MATEDDSVFVRLLNDDALPVKSNDDDSRSAFPDCVAVSLSIFLQFHVPAALFMLLRITVQERSVALQYLWEISDVFWIIFFGVLTLQLLHTLVAAPDDAVQAGIETHLRLLMYVSVTWDVIITVACLLQKLA